MTDRNLSSRLSLNCEPALFAPGSLTKNLNCACGVWPAALMAATPACAVASSLVLTTRALYLRWGGGAFLLWLPADAAAGSVRARTARADPTTLVHLTLDRIRASSSPGIPGLSYGCGTGASGAPLCHACLPEHYLPRYWSR